MILGAFVISMFEDWLKTGDILQYESDDGCTVMLVLMCTDIYMSTFYIDNWPGTITGSGVTFERPSTPNWNKRSHWIEHGWKFL